MAPLPGPRLRCPPAPRTFRAGGAWRALRARAAARCLAARALRAEVPPPGSYPGLRAGRRSAGARGRAVRGGGRCARAGPRSALRGGSRGRGPPPISPARPSSSRASPRRMRGRWPRRRAPGGSREPQRAGPPRRSAVPGPQRYGAGGAGRCRRQGGRAGARPKLWGIAGVAGPGPGPGRCSGPGRGSAPRGTAPERPGAGWPAAAGSVLCHTDGVSLAGCLLSPAVGQAAAAVLPERDANVRIFRLTSARPLTFGSVPLAGSGELAGGPPPAQREQQGCWRQ